MPGHNLQMVKRLVILWALTLPACTAATVYCCDSGSARRYHYDQNCRGLRTCQYHIVKTTLAEARKKGQTLCQWELAAER